MDWLWQTTKILNRNRLSGCIREPRTTKTRVILPLNRHIRYACAYSSNGSPNSYLTTRRFQGRYPSGELPWLLVKDYWPHLYPRQYFRGATMSWSAALCQQCMRAFPGSCHHVTKTDRNICRWLWRLCGGRGWWFTGCFLKGLLWHNLRPDARFITVSWPFLSYDAARQAVGHSKCSPDAFTEYPIGFLLSLLSLRRMRFRRLDSVTWILHLSVNAPCRSFWQQSCRLQTTVLYLYQNHFMMFKLKHNNTVHVTCVRVFFTNCAQYM